MEISEGINSTEFWRFAQEAAKKNLQYLVIGGMAMNFHGLIRNTIDCDVWLGPGPENLDKLRQVLLAMDYEKHELHFLEGESAMKPSVFSIEGPIDFLTEVHRNFSFADCQARSKPIELQGTPISVLSLIDLRELKILARRPQDIRDVGIIDDFLSRNST